MARRACTLAIAPLLLLASCGRPPPVLHRFLGVRAVGTPRGIEAAFGLCEGEVVTRVQLRLTDPPVPDGGVLWQIDSAGATVTRFRVGDTPSGFSETIPLQGTDLPSQYLAVVVRTNNEEWPETSFSFRPDDLPSNVFFELRSQGRLRDRRSRKRRVPPARDLLPLRT